MKAPVEWRVQWSWFWAVLLTPALAYAHCDIPCGIYSPWIAILASKTVWTMVKKILELRRPALRAAKGEWLAYHHALARMVRVKEEHAELCKRELQILWSDYFKPEHLRLAPTLHATFWDALKLCSTNKQRIDLRAAASLRTRVRAIADLFDRAEARAHPAAGRPRGG